MSDIHVTYDGDTYWLQCFRDDPSAEKGILIDPVDVGDSWVTLAGKVAEHEAQHGCSPAGEDAPVSGSLRCAECGTGAAEPEAAKVIVVVEAPAGDRAPVERRYLAHEADDHRDYGVLRIRRDDRVIAGYSQGQWASFREEGATVPDATARALGIAKRALEAVTRISDPNVAIQLATDALGEIFAETE